METFITWLNILGVPTLFTIGVWLYTKIKKSAEDTILLKKAVQGMMRHDLIADYKRYMQDGEINEVELFDWQDRYKSYHSLGQNGVLDAYNEDIINLSKYQA